MDKKSIVKQVMAKIDLEKEINNILDLVKKSPNAPKAAIDRLHLLKRESYGFNEFKEIFRAIEKSTYINPTNQNVWVKIYKDFGCNFPIDPSKFKMP